MATRARRILHIVRPLSAPLLASLLVSISALAHTANSPNPRIVGGNQAPADRWPWMTQLIINEPGGGRSLCGASQISTRWVLTAYHCTQYRTNSSLATANNMFVYIGETENKQLLPAAGRIAVEDIYRHRHYDDFSLAHDLALLRIPANSNEQWPSLPDGDTFDALESRSPGNLDESVTALGWGQTGSGSLSTILREVQLDYIPKNICQGLSSLLIPTSTICAAERNPVNGINQDTCFGDSGGPLFIDQDPNPWLVGLTSFGLQNCATGAPAGYTHLTTEIEEIEFLTADGGFPLVDMTFTGTATSRLYQPVNGTQTVTASLSNNSASNVGNNPTVRRGINGSAATTARFDWSGCSSLSNVTTCTVTNNLAAGASRTGSVEVTDSSGSEQVVTLTLTASADENDYRRRNDSSSREIVFSSNPDLALSATQQTSSPSQARVAVTLSNRSPLNAATGTGIRFFLPTNTQLLNSTELGCQQGSPIVCPVGNLAPQQSQALTLQFASDTGINQAFTFNASADQNDIAGDTDAEAKITVQYNATVSMAEGGGSSGGGGSTSLWLSLITLILAARRQ